MEQELRHLNINLNCCRLKCMESGNGRWVEQEVLHSKDNTYGWAHCAQMHGMPQHQL